MVINQCSVNVTNVYFVIGSCWNWSIIFFLTHLPFLWCDAFLNMIFDQMVCDKDTGKQAVG